MSGNPRRGGRPRRPANEQVELPTEPMIDPHGEADDVISDVPEMSVEEVEKRIGARDREARRRRRAAVAGETRIRTAPADRRVILWRDSATILVGVVLALLAARYLLPTGDGTAAASPSPGGSDVAVGTIPGRTGFEFTAVPTIGPIVNPSIHLNATPTPIPLITLRPAKPTPKPTTKPGTSPKPSSGSSPPPPLPPLADFICTPGAGFTMSFTNTSTGSITGWLWEFGDSTTSTLQNPPVKTYSGQGSYTVSLTVTGPGGTSTPTQNQCVAAP